jgi:OmpA-OmpF porin, OOP family
MRRLATAIVLVAAIATWVGLRLSVLSAAPAAVQAADGAPSERVDLLTFAQGAIPVSFGGSGSTLGVSFESAMRAIDGDSGGFGLSQKPGAADADLEFVYHLPAPTIFDRFAVPNVLETRCDG